ncbi:hypothetical protein GOP47_0006162 [Adiantum capillus-veneris]|uniref:Uncharacterized protein n=1 Tax=Adiantum capillus-veneris TaxID=13818 RepID=A0A9D4ZM98_ADICA|nr:hypothetical protein GOP47_0006162 [Adiantum capillus-veneris]
MCYFCNDDLDLRNVRRWQVKGVRGWHLSCNAPWQCVRNERLVLESDCVRCDKVPIERKATGVTRPMTSVMADVASLFNIAAFQRHQYLYVRPIIYERSSSLFGGY